MSLGNPMRMRYYMDIYREGLLNDTLPFWFPRVIDREHGGYLGSFDRKGNLLQEDKSVWFQGRIAWTLANLYNTVERRDEWLRDAKHGIDFIEKHCFDTDGRMFFSLTREGRPLRKRRYVFSETFAIIAFAAYGAAANDPAYIERACTLLEKTLSLLETPGALEPKTIVSSRPMKGLGIPMILIACGQELRKAAGIMLQKANESNETSDRSVLAVCGKAVESSNRMIDGCIEEIRRDFMKEQLACVLETVAPDGSQYDTFEGRLVCPGHSLEAGWFILEEARIRGGDRELVEIGTKIIDWSYRIGWDDVHGGILYYKDSQGGPSSEYWHDMKFWWPHNEAIIACLLAWKLTREERYAGWHRQVHEWAYARFPDPVYGEWFGYLHRDGTVSSDLKGNLWKGPFHLPRMQLYCWERLREEIE